MKLQAFRVELSRGEPIPIDADELPVVIEAIQRGEPAIVRQGIFNPSFYVSVVRDEKRLEDFWEQTKYSPERRQKGLEKLKNIFEGIGLTPSPELPAATLEALVSSKP